MNRSAALLLLALLVPLARSEEPRLRLRFDDNWKFHRDIENNVRHPDSIAWTWNRSSAHSLDDAPTATGDWLPYRTGQNVLHRVPEFGLFRAQLDARPLAGRVLHFESVDDNATVYVNGKRLGTQIGYGVPLDVNPAVAWHSGSPNELVVLVENTGGDGGINGDVTFEAPSPAEVEPSESKINFVDGAWRTVHLPHDYVVEGTFTRTEESSHGFLPKPRAWYRKSFIPPASWKGKSIWIDFDGVYRNSDVYLNGVKLGNHPSGYIGFRHDLSGRLRLGQRNVLAVRVDPRKDEGWWYEGGGIYRHVWLNVCNPVHVRPDSLFVDGSKPGRVKVSFLIGNASPLSSLVAIHIRWTDPNGVPGTQIDYPFHVDRSGATNFELEAPVPSPILWSPDSPRLYHLKLTITQGERVADSVEVPFGLRTIRFDKDLGLLVNGRPVKLKGTCNHQDFAGTGTAIPDSLFEWRLAQLKKMGSNSYRCSHNPPAPELLDACDRMGILVMDETRHLGDTELPKSPHGTTAKDLSEVRAMVQRDRNHPSVIIWSLYNEEPLQGTPEGASLFVKTRSLVDELDGTRPCAGATNYGYDRGIIDVTKLFGINYATSVYDSVHQRKPDLPLFGSETASTVSTRGEYVNDSAKGYVSAYDVNAPPWAATAENAWQPLAARPWMGGGFVWTGFDYKGEPTPYDWPCINSHFGILDIAGFPKDNFYYYQSVWGAKPMVHLMPSWNSAPIPGKPVDVWAYSNGDSVELFLNGRSLGRQPMPPLGHLSWSVPFEPGTLVAKSFLGPREIASDTVQTSGPAVGVRLAASKTKILGDGEDLTVVRAEIVDAMGRVVPDSTADITFAIEGAAKNGGVGNGDPSDHDSDKANHRKAFHGLCMVLAQSNQKSGPIHIRASSKGLRSAAVDLEAEPSALK